MRFEDVKLLPMNGPFEGVQAMLDFGEYHLSIVRHSGSYGNDEGKFEIGVFESKDGLTKDMVELPGITAPGDTVKGYLSDYEVDAIMIKMTAITGINPTQV